MAKIIAYLRTSTSKQDLSHQKLEILEFARKQELQVHEFVEITISSRKNSKQRRVDELLERLNDADILGFTAYPGQTGNEKLKRYISIKASSRNF